MLLLTTLIWGGTFPATKLLLSEGLLPMGLLELRFGIAATLFALLAWRRLRTELTSRTAIDGMVLGFLLYAGYALQTIGMGSTSSSRSGFITSMYVVVTPLILWARTRRLPGGNVLAGIALVLVGLWGLSAPGGAWSGLIEPWSHGGLGIGDLLTFLCAVVFSLYIIRLDEVSARSTPIALTFVQLSTLAVLSAVHRAIAEPFTMPSSIGGWALIVFLGTLASVASTFWQTRYQPATTPTRAGVIFTMESVFGALFSMLIGEQLGLLGWIGGGLIVAGLLATELGGKKR